LVLSLHSLMVADSGITLKRSKYSLIARHTACSWRVERSSGRRKQPVPLRDIGGPAAAGYSRRGVKLWLALP
jgi:hypothetical protein